MAFPRAAFEAAVRHTRRRPPRLTLESSPRWSRRQSVERETPNAWMASPIVSRFLGIASIEPLARVRQFEFRVIGFQFTT